MADTQFVEVQVGNQSFKVPIQGAKPSWAEDLSQIIIALAEVSQLIQNDSDILLSSAVIGNNQSSPVQFDDVSFSIASVLSFEMEYFITRIYDNGSTIVTENGSFSANYNTSGNWTSTQEGTGDSGVEFEMSAGGELQYTSTDLPDHVSSNARYRVKTIITES